MKRHGGHRGTVPRILDISSRWHFGLKNYYYQGNNFILSKTMVLAKGFTRDV